MTGKNHFFERAEYAISKFKRNSKRRVASLIAKWESGGTLEFKRQ
jgi:hypothetical protein